MYPRQTKTSATHNTTPPQRAAAAATSAAPAPAPNVNYVHSSPPPPPGVGGGAAGGPFQPTVASPTRRSTLHCGATAFARHGGPDFNRRFKDGNPYLSAPEILANGPFELLVDEQSMFRPPDCPYHAVPYNTRHEYPRTEKANLVPIYSSPSDPEPSFYYDCINGAGYTGAPDGKLILGWSLYRDDTIPRAPFDPVVLFNAATFHAVSTSSSNTDLWFVNQSMAYLNRLPGSGVGNVSPQFAHDLFRDFPQFTAMSETILQSMVANIELGISPGLGTCFTRAAAIKLLSAYLKDHATLSPDRQSIQFDLVEFFKMITSNPNLPHLIPCEFCNLLHYMQTQSFGDADGEPLQHSIQLLQNVGGSPFLSGNDVDGAAFTGPEIDSQDELTANFCLLDVDCVSYPSIRKSHDLRHIGSKAQNGSHFTSRVQVLKEANEMASEILLFIRQQLAPSPIRDALVALVELQCGVAAIAGENTHSLLAADQAAAPADPVAQENLDHYYRVSKSFRTPLFSYQHFSPSIAPVIEKDFSNDLRALGSREHTPVTGPFGNPKRNIGAPVTGSLKVPDEVTQGRAAAGYGKTGWGSGHGRGGRGAGYTGGTVSGRGGGSPGPTQKRPRRRHTSR